VLVLFASSSKLHAQSQSLSVELTGTAAIQSSGDLRIDPARLNFDTVDIGQSAVQTVQLSHIGAADADAQQINAVSIIGGHASEFSTDFSGFITLVPGDVIDVSVTYTPAVPGSKSASVRMDISGSGAPHVLIVEAAARFPLTSNLESDFETVDFGQVLQGVAKQGALVLTNGAQEPDAPVINIFGGTLSGVNPNSFNVNVQPATLAPGESTTLAFTLQDGTPGFRSAQLEIQHDGVNPAVEVTLQGNVVEPGSVPVNFGQSKLKGLGNIFRPTSLDFGPDGHLYVTEMEGLIHEFTVTRNGKNNYTAQKMQTMDVVAKTPNYDDDGASNWTKKRLITGILVVGTAANPQIYVHSGDWRQGGGPAGTDTNLDTNSGILHRLDKQGGDWVRTDLVRGLPRSEENHQGNGLVMMGNKLLLAMGGNTNLGLPSNNFSGLSETALSAAILEFDLVRFANT